MLQPPRPKSQKQRDAEEEFGKELRKLFERNKVSAQDSYRILEKAQKCGLEFSNPVKDSSWKTSKGSEPEKANSNAARTLKRFMTRKNSWSNFYWAQIPLYNAKTKAVSQEWLPFLLPHEFLSDYFYQEGAVEEAMPVEGTYRSQRLAEVCKAWDSSVMVPLGLHGDGVPIHGRMNQSTLDFLTINLPASECFQAERIPICCLEAKHNAGEETCLAICQVIAWSLRKLGEGIYPTERHDGEPFHSKKDAERRKLAGKPMPAKACLLEMRSDWDWNCKWYGTPANNQKCGCCWLCAAKPENWKSLSVEERKKMSLQQADWLSSLENRGKATNPLFLLPGVTNWSLLPDWMHVADEGCAALAAGQILHELLPSYAAPNQEARVGLLWDHIQSIYEAREWPAEKKLPKLTLKDIKKPGKAAELDVKAAQCRHFVPVVAILTEKRVSKLELQGKKQSTMSQNIVQKCMLPWKLETAWP